MSTKVGSMGSGRPVLGGHNTTRFFLSNHKLIWPIYSSGKYENLGESKWHLWLGGPRGGHARVAPCLAAHLSHCRLQQGATSDLTLFLESSMIELITSGSSSSLWEWTQILRWNWDPEDDGYLSEKQEGDWHCDRWVGFTLFHFSVAIFVGKIMSKNAWKQTSFKIHFYIGIHVSQY